MLPQRTECRRKPDQPGFGQLIRRGLRRECTRWLMTRWPLPKELSGSATEACGVRGRLRVFEANVAQPMSR